MLSIWQGNVTYGMPYRRQRYHQHLTFLKLALPSLHPGFGEELNSWLYFPMPMPCFLAIPTIKDGGNHTLEFAKAAATTEAHYACLDVSKALAATGMRVVTDEEFLARVCPFETGQEHGLLMSILFVVQVKKTFEEDKQQRDT